MKKDPELWSTNKKLVEGNVYNVLFSGHNISALKGCCALKFLHALEIDQRYLAHTPTGTAVPKKI